MTTVAERLAEEMGNDGSSWRTSDGRTLDDVCAPECKAMFRKETGDVRYTFADGSSIIGCAGGWDVGFIGCDCWCWAGGGHQHAGYEVGCVFSVASPEIQADAREHGWWKIQLLARGTFRGEPVSLYLCDGSILALSTNGGVVWEEATDVDNWARTLIMSGLDEHVDLEARRRFAAQEDAAMTVPDGRGQAGHDDCV